MTVTTGRTRKEWEEMGAFPDRAEDGKIWHRRGIMESAREPITSSETEKTKRQNRTLRREEAKCFRNSRGFIKHLGILGKTIARRRVNVVQ